MSVVPDVVVMADPRVSRIPVIECGEALVDLRDLGAVLVDPRRADPAGRFALVRASVAERLELAAHTLPSSLRLLVVEAYRPAVLQLEYFLRHRDRVAASNPGADATLLQELISRYIAPPDHSPHVAGAAVDVTLCRTDGTELDLGTPVQVTPQDSEMACYTAAPNVGRHAAAQRRLLVDALTRGGLVNYPSLWWQWSYGDRYWAMETGAPTAIYGPVAR
jgi:D-alanyl-D-alanine dipeptidase